MWRLRKGAFAGPVLCVAFHPAGLPFVLTGTGASVNLYNTQTGQRVLSLDVIQNGRVHDLKSAPKNESSNVWQVAVFGGKKLSLIAIDIGVNSEPVATVVSSPADFHDWILDVQWLQDDMSGSLDLIAVAMAHGQVEIWNWTQTKRIHAVNCEERCILYSAQLFCHSMQTLVTLAGTVFNEILLWDTRSDSGRVLYRFKGHLGVIFAIRFNSDGTQFCSASDDRTVRIWKTPDSSSPVVQSELLCLWGHEARVWDCCLLSNFALSASEDGTARIWDIATGQCLRVLRGHWGAHVWCIAVDQQENLVATGGGDFSLRLWPARQGQSFFHETEVDLSLPNELISENGEIISLQDDGIRLVALSRSRDSVIMTTMFGHVVEYYNESWLLVHNAAQTQLKFQFLALSKCERWLCLWNSSGKLRVKSWPSMEHSVDHDFCCTTMQVIWGSSSSCSSGQPVAHLFIQTNYVDNLRWIVVVQKDDGSSCLEFKREFLVSTALAAAPLAASLLKQDQSNSKAKRTEEEPHPAIKKSRVDVEKEAQSDEEDDVALPKAVPHTFAPSSVMSLLQIESQRGFLIVVGTYNGSIILFETHKEDRSLEHASCLQVLLKTHGNQSVVSTLDLVTSSSPDKQEDSYEFVSGGRDGYVCRYQLTSSSTEGFKIERTARSRAGLGISLVGRVFMNDQQRFLTLGFQKKHFLVCDERSKVQLFRSMCFGGHRPWDFIWIDDDQQQARFAFVRNKHAFVHRRDPVVSTNAVVVKKPILEESFHGKSIASLAFLRSFGPNHLVFVTGGEDTRIRLVDYHDGVWNPLQTLEGHASAVKALAVLQLNSTDHVMFSGGGQSQLFAWLISHHGESFGVSLLARYQIDRHQDNRIMSITAWSLQKSHDSVVAVASSDGNVILYGFRFATRRFICLGTSNFHQHCLLSSAYVFAFDNTEQSALLLTAATDGRVALFIVGSLVQQFSTASSEMTVPFVDQMPLLTWFAVHPSGVNCMIAHAAPDGINSVRITVATGGDDNSLQILRFRLQQDQAAVTIDAVTQMRVANAHTAPLKGLHWLRPNMTLASVAVDQRLYVWDVSDATCSPKFVSGTMTDVLDITCLQGDLPSDPSHLVVAGGALQLFNISCLVK